MTDIKKIIKEAIDSVGHGRNYCPDCDGIERSEECGIDMENSPNDGHPKYDGTGPYNKIKENDVDMEHDTNNHFTAHGTYSVSNAGGYEIMISDDGGMAKVKDAYGSDNPQISDWLTVEEVPMEDGETQSVIDPNGYNIPLDMVMRNNLSEADVDAAGLGSHPQPGSDDPQLNGGLPQQPGAPQQEAQAQDFRGTEYPQRRGNTLEEREGIFEQLTPIKISAIMETFIRDKRKFQSVYNLLNEEGFVPKIIAEPPNPEEVIKRQKDI